MTKFFRTIRQNLLNEGKTTKYFRYAVGEIVLVVIGILIALQINNWNTNRQNNEANVRLLKKIKVELQLNIDRLTHLKSFDRGYTNRIQINDSLIAILSRGATLENLEQLITGFYVPNTLNLHTSTYEEMKNTGRLYSLGSDSLMNAIENYYKLCERESYYVTYMNNEVEEHISADINKGWFKAQQDFYALEPEFTIKDNAWLFNKQAKEYNELRRQVGFANYYLGIILRRIDRLIEASKNLQTQIEDELK